jgi:hypothetical protein
VLGLAPLLTWLGAGNALALAGGLLLLAWSLPTVAQRRGLVGRMPAAWRDAGQP